MEHFLLFDFFGTMTCSELASQTIYNHINCFRNHI